MTIFKDQVQILEAVLTSFEYNYDDKYLIDVYEDVINRLQNGPYRRPTEEGHIINGILTLLYGDYGTSPRYGWIDKDKAEVKEDCIQVLKYHIDDLNNRIMWDELINKEDQK